MSQRIVPHHLHFGYKTSIDYIHRLVTETPFAKKFELEESTQEWTEFRDSLPKRDRFQLCTQRVVGNAIWRAKVRNLCQYCWMPSPCCSCNVLKKVVSATNDQHNFITVSSNKNKNRNLIKPVFLLHPDEFLSPTNSGHIAAICLDAPIVIWGMPGFEDVMKKINHLHIEEYPLFLERAIAKQQHQQQQSASKNGAETTSTTEDGEKNNNNNSNNAGDKNDLENFYHQSIVQNRSGRKLKPKVSLLYPEDNCEIMETYIRREVLSSVTEENISCNDEKNKVGHNDDDDTVAEKVVHDEPSTINCDSPQEFIIILLDATWPQAHRLNRHLPRNDPVNAPPRVSLVIDNEAFGKGLFEPLRKRTRETGCSTLEATAMALSQLILAFGTTNIANDQNNNNNDENNSQLNPYSSLASSVSVTMLWDMSLFVDLVVTLKHLPSKSEHEFHGGEIAEIVAEISKALPGYTAFRREDALAKKPEPVSLEHLKAEGILAPMPLRYCYICMAYVGVNRMHEHCLGTDHTERFFLRVEEKRQEELSRGNTEATKEDLIRLAWFPRTEAQNNTALPDAWKLKAANSAQDPMRQRRDDDDHQSDDEGTKK